MRSLVIAVPSPPRPEALLQVCASEPGIVLLRTAWPTSLELPASDRSSLPTRHSSHAPPSAQEGAHPTSAHARYSFFAARPFLTFRAAGTQCTLQAEARTLVQFGDPWRLLEEWIGRYELPNELDQPFPLGGCFGLWGYELRHHLERTLTRRAVRDVELPDLHVGFYDSLCVFDHELGRVWIVATGLLLDGSRSHEGAERQIDWWQRKLTEAAAAQTPTLGTDRAVDGPGLGAVSSSMSRPAFIAAVRRAQAYIRAGDIYQVNLAQRLSLPCPVRAPDLFGRLLEVSPAPFAAFLDAGDFQIVSSSPELFLRLSAAQVTTRPIKGTRPRSRDPARDAQLADELQASPKELAELVMITDLLRNDLGRVCAYGSVQVRELARLERFAQVQHLVSTVEGRLRPDVSHLGTLAACFPGGSITGAPKIRAMQIIDELEPVARGPYTGALGFLGFNRESELSVLIRAAVLRDGVAWFHAGAGIVADSVPEAEYDETLAKAEGFLQALAGPFAGAAPPPG